MLTGLPNLTRISKAQETRASETLTSAFEDYPLFTHLIPAKLDRDRKLRIFFGFMIRTGILYGEVYTTSPNMEGIAVWFPSANAEISTWKMVRAGGLSLIYQLLMNVKNLVPKLLAYNKYASQMHSHNAPFPHMYLNLLGVDPRFQGRGYASALMRPMLARIDEKHLPCFLETHHKLSLPIYERYGFRIVEEGTMPGTDIAHYAMLR